jgi:hypothetical protein
MKCGCLRVDWRAVLAGVVLLLVVKYALVGLRGWNELFHPGRVESGGWESSFESPLLGVLGK